MVAFFANKHCVVQSPPALFCCWSSLQEIEVWKCWVSGWEQRVECGGERIWLSCVRFSHCPEWERALGAPQAELLPFLSGTYIYGCHGKHSRGQQGLSGVMHCVTVTEKLPWAPLGSWEGGRVSQRAKICLGVQNGKEKWRFCSQNSWCAHVYAKDLVCSIYCQWGKITGPVKDTISFLFYFGSNSIWIWNPNYDFFSSLWRHTEQTHIFSSFNLLQPFVNEFIKDDTVPKCFSNIFKFMAVANMF